MENNDSEYLDIYKWDKYLVLKISWELLEKDDFSEFIEYVKHLKQIGIPIILVYGWWSQISQKYKENTWEKRKKWSDWKNITTKEILKEWVLPANEDILNKLLTAFEWSEINIFSPEDIDVKKIDWLGEVWAPLSFNKKFDPKKINIIPFVWQKQWSDNLLNINADDIVKMMSDYFSEQISKIIFLTWTWWLLDKKSELITFLSKENLERVLNKKHENIEVEWWMLKKLESILAILKNWVKKVTVTGLSDLKTEMELIDWSWTMFMNLQKATFKKLKDKSIFEQIYEKLTSMWKWKTRSHSEKNEISADYTILELEWTILWWYHLWNHEETINWKVIKWKLLQTLFASKSWWWIWQVLWEEIKKEPIVFAYSKNWFFEKLWFQKIDGIYSETWAPLYLYKA